MRRIALLTLVAGLVPFMASAPASAPSTQTWFSDLGDYYNPCSRTAPCKTFPGAISKTSAGGEINCLDPGGMGTVTITKPITLNCFYTLGSILAAGVPAVIINSTGVNDRVVLRGIQMQGINQSPSTAGTIGVRIIAAKSVSIEDSVITNFGQQGIADQRTAGNTNLFIRNSVISNNTGTGIGLGATNTSKTHIENSSSINNLFGVAATTGNSVTVKRSVMAANADSGVEADAGAQVDVDDTSITNNTTGVQAN